MMNTTQKSFFIGDCSKGVNAALPMARAGERSLAIYHTVGTIREGFEQTTRRLLRLAELAHGQRDYDVLNEISMRLQAIPFQPAQNAARYYAAILAKRQGELASAVDLLSSLTAPRAIQTLATVYEAQGNYDEAVRLNTEAMRAAHGVDPLTIANAGAQLAIIKSIASDHHGALADLQRLLLLVRAVASTHGYLYGQWCNAVAVELAAVGNLDEARRVIAPALASPILDRFPEYQATAKELQQPARIVVVVPEQGSEPTEFLPIVSRNPRRASGNCYQITFAIIPNARILHARASPRAPPSLS
jgi:tetratricopeptide (TPR) repeat protein